MTQKISRLSAFPVLTPSGPDTPDQNTTQYESGEIKATDLQTSNVRGIVD